MQFQGSSTNFPRTSGTKRDATMKSNGRFHELDDVDRDSVERLIRIIDLFRTLDARMPSSYIRAFLAVCLKPGAGPTDYAKDMGTIQPIMSRLLLEIGKKARERDEGLGLVDRQASPESLRNQEYYLTPKGRHLLSQILNTIGDKPSNGSN